MLCVTHFDMFYSITLMCSSLFHATKNSVQISLKLLQQSIMVATQSWKCTGEGSSGPGFMIDPFSQTFILLPERTTSVEVPIKNYTELCHSLN